MTESVQAPVPTEVIAALQERVRDLEAQLVAARKPSARAVPRAAQVWFSQQQLASFFNLSTQTITDWIRAGDFGDEWMRVGGDYRVSASGYETLVQKKCAARFFGAVVGQPARSARRNARGQIQATGVAATLEGRAA